MWGKLYGELIVAGKFDYEFVIGKRPQDKDDIDSYLIKNDRADLIK